MFAKRAIGRRHFLRKFELLEDRRLLTTYHVTTTADVVDPLDGKLSLREAIDLANAHPGPDVIVLKALPHDSYKITIAGGGEDNNANRRFRHYGRSDDQIGRQRLSHDRRQRLGSRVRHSDLETTASV